MKVSIKLMRRRADGSMDECLILGTAELGDGTSPAMALTMLFEAESFGNTGRTRVHIFETDGVAEEVFANS